MASLTGTGSDTGSADTGTETGAGTGTGTNTETGTNAGTGSNAGTGTNAGTGSNAGTGTNAGTETGTGSDTGPETAVDPGTDTGTGRDIRTNTGTRTGRDTGPDTAAGSGDHTGTDGQGRAADLPEDAGAGGIPAEALRARRLVVKIGSALLVDGATGDLREGWLSGLAGDLAAIRARGTDVVVVSSGSIALGRGVLGLGAVVLPLEQSQAAAAVGQIRLARAYEAALARHGITAAQVLVTLEDTEDRRRYLNTRATLETLLGMGAVPIVNENDTVATDEIRYGDNDRLAAQVAVTVGADHLLLLSDVDGLYTANPQTDPAARHLPRIAAVTPEIEAMAGDPGSYLSRGGMRTKIMAAKTATAGGCAMTIALGTADRPLHRLALGAAHSLFAPQGDPQTARKRWIAAMKDRGRLTVDDGAAAALRAGKSLLPAGVTEVAGSFARGDPVAVVDAAGRRLAVGLVRYAADEARRIRGRRSSEIAELLGYPARAALIHRDDMAF